MAINITPVTTTTVADNETIAAATENSNNNNLKNKTNEIITAIEDINTGDVAGGAAGDATLESMLTQFREDCYVYRIDGTHIGVSKGQVTINNKTRAITSAISSTFSVPDNGDWLDVWALADAAATVPTISIVDSGAAPGGSSNPGTSGRLLGSILYDDGTALITKVINYMPSEVVGWSYIVGTGGATLSETVTHGVSFVSINSITGASNGTISGSTKPTDLTKLTTSDGMFFESRAVAATTAEFYITNAVGGTIANTEYVAYSYVIKGEYS